MSWSVLFIGTPENIIKALEEESERLTDQSKIEFDATKSALIELCRNNFVEVGAPTLRLEASGHGYARADGPVNRNVQVALIPLYGRLV